MASFGQLLTADPKGFAGSIAENGAEIDSEKCDTAGLNPGLAVLRDQTDGLLRAPASAADVADLDGVVAYDPFNIGFDATYDYGSGDVVPYCRKGAIYALGEEAMALGDDVYVRFATSGGNTVLGKVRNDANASAAGTATGATITVADNDDGAYTVTLRKDSEAAVTFSYTASSKTAAEIATALASAIDAHPDFAAAAVDTVVTVTCATATSVVTIEEVNSPENASPNMTYTQGAATGGVATAALCSKLRVAEPSSGAGIVKLRLNF